MNAQAPTAHAFADWVIATTARRGTRWRHGYSRTPVHNSWSKMIDRCTNKASSQWSFYGARGITICERWLVFENFLADMGDRPVGTTLDRANTNGNYEPGNCRWATYAEQGRNRRSARLTAADVETIRGLAGAATHKAIALRFGVSRSTVTLVLAGKTWQ